MSQAAATDPQRQPGRAAVAAWMGMLFDGLETYLFILVAAPLIAELIQVESPRDPRVAPASAIVQAVFLVGWGVGGVLFGRLGDWLGRVRVLSWTILLYAMCAALTVIVQTYEQLIVLRFLTAVGIGGEWAAGAALVAETWPARARVWLSPWLQTAYAMGMIAASVVVAVWPISPRWVFLAGAAPALLVFWIRLTLEEPRIWSEARRANETNSSRVGWRTLFQRELRGVTVFALLISALAISNTWLIQFWTPQLLRSLPGVGGLPPEEISRFVGSATLIYITATIPGFFLAAWLGKRWSPRVALTSMFLGGAVAVGITFGWSWPANGLILGLCFVCLFTGGVFGLFPVYLPSLFPVLTRTTGAGLCYNCGRFLAAAGTVVLSLTAPVARLRPALLIGGVTLCLLAMFASRFAPESWRGVGALPGDEDLS